MSHSKIDLLFVSCTHSGACRGFYLLLVVPYKSLCGSSRGVKRQCDVQEPSHRLIKIKRSTQVHLRCFCFFLIIPMDGMGHRVAPPPDHRGPSELIKPPGPRGPSGSGPLLARSSRPQSDHRTKSLQPWQELLPSTHYGD